MKLQQFRLKKPDCTLWGFLLPFMGMGLVLLISKLIYEGPIYEMVYPAYASTAREYSTLYSDMYHQYFPFFKAYRQALLSGDSLLHSWNVGLGMDYLGLISYYLASPLYLLSVFLPESWLLGYFTFLIPVKLGLAGLFCTIFLKKVFDKNEFSVAVFGSFYALCAWALGYHWNIMWLDTFTLLPLVALGTVSILKERKFVLYTVSLFLSVFSNYYIGLFTCIFVLLICICYEICRFAGFKKLFADIGLMALFSILAIGMTAILELPTLASLATTESSLGHTLTWEERNIAADSSFLSLLDAMRQVAGNMNGGLEPNFKASEGLPNIYCGIGTTIFAFLFLTCKEIRLRDKLCAVGLLLFFNVSFIIKMLDYLWHGTHVPNMIPYRFSFLYSFVLVYMAYSAWNQRKHIRLWQVGIAMVLALTLLLISNGFQDLLASFQTEAFAQKWQAFTQGQGDLQALGTVLEELVYPAYNGVFLLLYLSTTLFTFLRPRASKDVSQEDGDALQTRRRIGSALIVGVFCAEQVLNLINFGIAFFPGTNVAGYPMGRENTAQVVQVMKEREKDTLFYRAETTHTQTLNDGALNGYNGVSTFTSSANMKVTNFMKALGYAAEPSWNRYVFEEASPVANMFLNLKYTIERSGNVEDNPYYSDVYSQGNVHLLKNDVYLPLGFMTDEALASLSFQGNQNRFEFQNSLLSCAVGKEVTPWTLMDRDNLAFASREVTLSSSNRDTGYTYYTAGSSGGSVYYTYTFDKAGLFCVDVNTPKRNSFTFSHEAAGSDYKTLYTETCNLKQMLAVCQVNPGDRIQITVKCPANESGSVTMTGAVLDENLFRTIYGALSVAPLELTAFENTFVEGTVTCLRDGLLYTSIPQDGNWKVWVDGEETEVTLIGDAMVGVMLTEGTHTVTFRYENKAFTLGAIISAVCLVDLVTLWWLCYRKPWRKKLPLIPQPEPPADIPDTDTPDTDTPEADTPDTDPLTN